MTIITEESSQEAIAIARLLEDVHPENIPPPAPTDIKLGRICEGCDNWLDLENFYKKDRGYLGRYAYCKKCHQLKYRTATWSRQIKRRYSLPKEVYDDIINSTTECEACGVFLGDLRGSGVGKCLDHDHRTGKIRGVLCQGCNIILGRANDDPIRLKQLIKYLEVTK